MIPKLAVDALINLWPILILLSVVLITLRIAYLKVNRKPIIFYKELISLCFLLYMIMLFELVTSTDFESFSNNFIPFKEMFRYDLFSVLFFRNVLGNIVLFIPFGYFTSYFCKINKITLSIFITLITSLCIEIIQANIGRSFDIDDIILNVIGGFIGYLVYLITTKFLTRYSNVIKNNLLVNFILIIVIIILCLFILGLYGVVL